MYKLMTVSVEPYDFERATDFARARLEAPVPHRPYPVAIHPNSLAILRALDRAPDLGSLRPACGQHVYTYDHCIMVDGREIAHTPESARVCRLWNQGAVLHERLIYALPLISADLAIAASV